MISLLKIQALIPMMLIGSLRFRHAAEFDVCTQSGEPGTAASRYHSVLRDFLLHPDDSQRFTRYPGHPSTHGVLYRHASWHDGNETRRFLHLCAMISPTGLRPSSGLRNFNDV